MTLTHHSIGIHEVQFDAKLNLNINRDRKSDYLDQHGQQN